MVGPESNLPEGTEQAPALAAAQDLGRGVPPASPRTDARCPRACSRTPFAAARPAVSRARARVPDPVEGRWRMVQAHDRRPSRAAARGGSRRPPVRSPACGGARRRRRRRRSCRSAIGSRSTSPRTRRVRSPSTSKRRRGQLQVPPRESRGRTSRRRRRANCAWSVPSPGPISRTLLAGEALEAHAGPHPGRVGCRRARCRSSRKRRACRRVLRRRSPPRKDRCSTASGSRPCRHARPSGSLRSPRRTKLDRCTLAWAPPGQAPASHGHTGMDSGPHRALMGPGHAWRGYAGLSMARLVAQVVGTDPDRRVRTRARSRRDAASSRRSPRQPFSPRRCSTWGSPRPSPSSSRGAPPASGCYRRHLVHIAIGWAFLLAVRGGGARLAGSRHRTALVAPVCRLGAAPAPGPLPGRRSRGAAGRPGALAHRVGRSFERTRAGRRVAPGLRERPVPVPPGGHRRGRSRGRPGSPKAGRGLSASRRRADGRPWRSSASRIAWACAPTRRCFWASS